MCRAMEEMRNETAVQTLFDARLDGIRRLMEKLGWTKEKALEFYDIPIAEYPKYFAALV